MLATISRTIIIYAVVTIALRLMGKRQIGDMQPNELVITLLISEIAAIPLQDSNEPIVNGIAAILVLISAEILLSALSLKSPFVHRLLSDRAVVLIKDGKIDEKAMKRVRITALDLLELLRGKDVFDINEVDFAVLEVNGELNIFKKSPYKTVTRKDLDIKDQNEKPLLPVVADRSVVNDFLSTLDIKSKSINDKLKENSIKRENTFLAFFDKTGKSVKIDKEKSK